MRWHHKPKQSNWGEFGPDDEVGRLNLITPEKVLQGIAEVREGRTFCLCCRSTIRAATSSIPLGILRGGAQPQRPTAFSAIFCGFRATTPI